MTRILAVEDDDDLRADILVAVELAGLDPDAAVAVASSAAAFSAVADAERGTADAPPFDIAVVDLSLVTHGLDDEGVELIRWLHASRKSRYIIAVTSHPGEIRVRQAARAGANTFISRRPSEKQTWIASLAAFLRTYARAG